MNTSLLHFGVRDIFTGGFIAAVAAFSLLPVGSNAQPAASFTFGPASGSAPLTVNFTNTSTGYSSALWAFGDGGASPSTNAVVTYIYGPGTNTVSLTVSNSSGVYATYTLTNAVGVTAYAPAFLPPVLSNDQITLSWAGGGQFLWATNLLGPWSTNTATSPYTVTPAGPQLFYRVQLTGASAWTEQILNGDGTINWAEYENVATNASQLAVRDYLLGPKYAYYHPQAGSFPTLALQGDTNGWQGPAGVNPPAFPSNNTDWYAQAGPLIYVADDPHNAGVISAGNGEMFIYPAGTTPPYGFWCKVNWQSWRCCYLYPVPPELSQPDWNSPKKPVAVATPTGTAALAQYVAFQNGFIGTFAIDKCAYTHPWGCGAIGNYSATGNIFPWVQLPAGKVPMALAVTPCGEFVLAAVWDVINHKGQLAVIAVRGRVRCSETINKNWDAYFNTGTWLYGFPTWPNTKGLKLLGFVDLPIAAPMAIKAGTSMGWQSGGRGDNNVNSNLTALLNNQSERNTWYNSDPTVYPNYKATAHAGYAIVTSRSENKVVFIDLQPLLAYYRTMYFTTQANYNQTTNTGPATNQWPYTFDYVSGQMPVVAYTLDVPSPTAVACGLGIGDCAGGACAGCNASWNSFLDWRVTPFGDQYTYVTTMDGSLLMYTVGGLNGQAAGTAPALYQTITIGKNPTSIENGNGGMYKNDIFINCRGDKSIHAFQPSGTLSYVLRDSRINDPVMAENSYNGRQGVNRYFIHVVDFGSKDVLTYVYQQGFPAPMTFGAASAPVPGYPFAYQQDEVP